MKKIILLLLVMVMVLSGVTFQLEVIQAASSALYKNSDLVTMTNGDNALNISEYVDELSDDLTFNTTFTCTGSSVNSLLFIGNSETQNNYFTVYLSGTTLGIEHRNVNGGHLVSGATVVLSGIDLTKEHKLSVVYDGMNEYKMYVDGELVKQGSTSSNIVSSSIPDVNYMGIGIGNRKNAASNYPFTGTQKNVEVYNSVLSEEEIEYYHSDERKDLLFSVDNLYFGDHYASMSDEMMVAALKTLDHGSISIRYRVEDASSSKMSLVSFSNSNSDNEHMSIYVNPKDNQVGIEINGTDLPIPNAKVNDTKWHTLTMTKTNATANNRYTFYVDGQKINMYSNRENFLNQMSNANVIAAGYTDLLSDKYLFKGGIDNISFYSGIVSEDEAMDLHSSLVYDAPMVDDLSHATKTPMNEVFYSGYDGSIGYRIPSMIVTKEGTIIAATDQRNSGLGDAGNIDFILRRKEVGDKEFGDPIEVIDLIDHNNSTPCAFLIDASMVQDQESGRIFAFIDMFPESSGLMNPSILSTGNGYKEIDGELYQLLFDTNNNEYTVRENGIVYDSHNVMTDYRMVVECVAPFKELGNLYKNGEPVGNAYIFSGVNKGELHVQRSQYLWMTYSDDDGRTWSCPKDISKMVKEDWMMFIGTGPGCGIQLNNGDLAVPVYTANANVGASQASALIISEDGGETWKLHESPVKVEGNDRATMTSGNILTESQVVQMNNGDLKLFMRCYGGKVKMATSHDNGRTWATLEILDDVANVYCQLSVVHYNDKDGNEHVLLVNPKRSGRNDLTAYLGTVEDDGSISWINKLIDGGRTQYSSLIHLGSDEHGDEKFAVLYELDARGAMSQVYVEFDENWIKTPLVKKQQSTPELLNIETVKNGQVLSIELTFDQSVMAVGTPLLTLNKGVAFYKKGSGSDTLVFEMNLSGNEKGVLYLTGIQSDNGYLESTINDEIVVDGYVYALNRIENVGVESYSSQHSSSTAENTDGAAVNVVDNNINTYWHSTWGNSSITLPQHVVIDLGGVEDLYKIDYVGRQNSQSGRVIEYEISVSTDGETYNVVKNGKLANSAELQSIEFSAVKARYVKFNVLKSSVEGSCSIAELDFYAFSDELANHVDKDLLETLYNNVKDIDLTNMSKVTKDKFSYYLDYALSLLDNEKVTQGLIDEAYHLLFNAKRDLVNVERLLEYKNNLEINEKYYTSESWDAYCESKPNLEEVKNNAETSKDVTNAMMKYEYAMSLLIKKDVVLEESVTLDKTTAELKVNDTLTLNSTILPEEATDKSVTWTSSNPKVATVKDGVVTALKAGTTTITVTTTNGLKATCKVTVLKDFPFTDVSDKQWYYGVINEAYQLGLMTGASDSLFKPNANMNRGMVAIVFHRMEGSKQVEYSSIFPDVANKQYYTTSVLWAKQTGVINGYTNGTFKPLRNVTREEMATMIYNFARYKGLDMSASKDITYFSDYSQITPYAVGPLQWAVEKGLMSGKLNGTKLDPLGNATRAECSKMLVQAYKVIYK